MPLVEPYDMARAAELPRNSVAWQVDADRAVLVIHDMQDKVVDSFDATRSPALELVHNVGKLRDTCRDVGAPVVHTVRGRAAGRPTVRPLPCDLVVDAEAGSRTWRCGTSWTPAGGTSSSWSASAPTPPA
ncbi:hypothetical protein ACFQV2_15790 [Actinokineospora soli]|uniref:Isochorismatase family protein n=1 Tax=Actinokineospora soli TaxID=1048753 RepID=A0ABW2TPQ2_9PSEU